MFVFFFWGIFANIIFACTYHSGKKFTKIENEHHTFCYWENEADFLRLFTRSETYNRNKFRISFIGELQWNIALKMEKESVMEVCELGELNEI